MKIMTVVGTRPELIRLSRVVPKLDEVFDHTLVHTGQNWDRNLNEIFFREMEIRNPDIYLDIDVTSLGSSIAGVISGTEKIIKEVEPEAFLVLGDTNSALSLVMAKRMRIPTYHMEAGNRCFNERVPEEINRRLLDHTADYNLVYTEHARRNLLSEGLHPSRVTLTGSPLCEVIADYGRQIAASSVVSDLDLHPNKYLVVSLHREETVDDWLRLGGMLDSLSGVADALDLPLVMSVHPRTRERLRNVDLERLHPAIKTFQPFGFFDYCQLQMNSFCTLSDSGTVSEEGVILNFPAVTLRAAIERPEALETGVIVLASAGSQEIIDGIALARMNTESRHPPFEYQIPDTSHRVATFIHSTAPLHR